jgi:predicted component of type VI protein secretion system
MTGNIRISDPIKSNAYILPSEKDAKASKSPKTRVQIQYEKQVLSPNFGDKDIKHGYLIDDKKLLNIRSQKRVYKQKPSLLFSKLFYTRLQMGDKWVIVNKESLRKRLGMTKDEFKELNKGNVIDNDKLKQKLDDLVVYQNHIENLISEFGHVSNYADFRSALSHLKNTLNKKNYYEPSIQKALEEVRPSIDTLLGHLSNHSLNENDRKRLIVQITDTINHIKDNLWWSPKVPFEKPKKIEDWETLNLDG